MDAFDDFAIGIVLVLVALVLLAVVGMSRFFSNLKPSRRQAAFDDAEQARWAADLRRAQAQRPGWWTVQW